jgi:predicted transposase/invertase (TIGR01784 family)
MKIGLFPRFPGHARTLPGALELCLAPNPPEKELNESVRQLFEEGGEIMQTIAEKWKREGKREGIKEGKLETAKQMLLDDISIEKIIKYTGLSEKEVKALMN